MLESLEPLKAHDELCDVFGKCIALESALTEEQEAHEVLQEGGQAGPTAADVLSRG